MKNPEITKFLAEAAMGWTEKMVKYGTGGKYNCWVDKETNKPTLFRVGEFHPMDSINHAYMVEDAIEPMGGEIRETYLQELEKLCPSLWTQIHATPFARTLAATRALATPDELKGFGL